jgi:hypothetical protein
LEATAGQGEDLNAVDAVRAASVNPDSISSRNPADVNEILERGFHALRAIGRGQYQFERASSTRRSPMPSMSGPHRPRTTCR